VADEEGGGSKVLRGLLIAVFVVAAIILVAVFFRQVGDAGSWLGRYVGDHLPPTAGQKVTTAIYLILAVLLSIMFSKAGHFTAYGIAMGLGPLLWFLFWEGFPLMGLHPTWIESLGLAHLHAGIVILWAIIADVIITLVFFPLELREAALRRRHRLGEDD
jgi:hypothetical protein